MKKKVSQYAWLWLLLVLAIIVPPAFSQDIPLQPTMADIAALPDQEKIAYQKGVEEEDATRGFFAWNDGIHGTELWSWDFTGNGEAVMLADLFPGLDDTEKLNSSFPHDFFIYCDNLYFLAQAEYDLGMELWVIDGESQPKRVFDQTSTIRNLRSPIVWHNMIYFIADEVPGGMISYVWYYNNLNPPIKAPFILPGMACFPVEKLISTGVDVLLVKVDPDTGEQILW
jgi:ELWxxDGT repeat protein